MYPDCFKDLVGLTEQPCECLTGSDISNESTLGLFVTQDPAYDSCRLKNGDTFCELVKMMADLREEALRQVYTDIGAVLQGKVKSRDQYNYFIGQNETGSYLSDSLVPANAGLTIYTENQPNAVIRIDKVALMIYPKTTPLTVPLNVYKVHAPNDMELLHTWNIVFPAGTTRVNKTPQSVVSVTLPADGSEYRVEYNFDSDTMQVPDTNYHCGCGDKLKGARGFIRENISKTYGVSLWTTMYCAGSTQVCSLLDNETYRMVIGYMIRKLILTMLLKKEYYAQDVNKYSLLSPEDMLSQIESYSLEYNNRLIWLESQKDFPSDGFCITCGNGRTGMGKFNMLTGR